MNSTWPLQPHPLSVLERITNWFSVSGSLATHSLSGKPDWPSLEETSAFLIVPAVGSEIGLVLEWRGSPRRRGLSPVQSPLRISVVTWKALSTFRISKSTKYLDNYVTRPSAFMWPPRSLGTTTASRSQLVNEQILGECWLWARLCGRLTAHELFGGWGCELQRFKKPVY